MLDLGPGVALGKYRIVRLLGRGGMGVVYLAEDQGLGREVALKILDRNITFDSALAHRFRQEARTVAALKHPNIVPIHALEQINSDLVIEMEYVEGGTLAAATSTLAGILLYVQDVLEALECCHEAGIVHRDVKPSNVLLSSRGRAMLSDFGLSKLLAEAQTLSMASRTSSGMFLGTPLYAPQEAWEGEEPTPAWDVYSVGLILFECVAGRLPYQAQTPLSLLKEMLDHPPPPLSEVAPGVSPELSAVVETMLQRDRKARFRDGAEALAHLRKVPELQSDSASASRTVMMRTPTLRKPPGRRWREAVAQMGARRSSRIIWLVATLLVLGGIGAAIWQLVPVPPSVSVMLPSADEFVFDTINPLTAEIWPNHWLFQPGSEADTWVAVAHRATHLWFLTLSPMGDGKYAVEGGWGEYTDMLARFFHGGTVKGMGRWLTPGQEMTLSLTFESTQDGTRRQDSLVLRRGGHSLEKLAYLSQLQKNDYSMPLLYNELQPRGVNWVETVETRFLVAASPRVRAALLAEDAGPVNVDGRIEESIWAPLRGQHTGDEIVVDSAGSLDGRLSLAHDDSRLLIGILLERAPAAPAVTITLLERFDIPTRQSPRWSVRFEDGAVEAHRHLAHLQAAAWTCEWGYAAAPNTITGLDGSWGAEISIPFQNLGRTSFPTTGERWRLNVQVHDGGSDPDAPEACWGAIQPEAIEEGLIVAFDSQ